MTSAAPARAGTLARLRAFAEAPSDDRCELCGAAIGERHDHLVDPTARALSCACAACALLFAGAHSRWRRVEHRVERAPLAFTDAEWAALAIPVSVVFFVRAAGGGGAAFYPSPAGATESPLDAGAWSALAAAHPLFDAIAPEVEALLIDRGACTAWRVSIDECHRLTGLLRARWRGLGGGAEAWTALRGFFDELDGAARA
jgi:hypothetical protein